MRVEVARGLVGEQDGRLGHHRTCDRHALLLTAGQLARQVPRPVSHADALERLVDALAPLGLGHPHVGERQLDVLVDRQVADQVEALEDEPDLAVPRARALGDRQALDRPIVQPVLALRVGVSSRPRIDSSVDLPQPDGPAIATYSPKSIVRWMPSRAWVSISSPSKTLRMPSSRISGVCHRVLFSC